MYLSVFTSSSSGSLRLMLSIISSPTTMDGTSVSGYILAEPGIGLMKRVEPSALVALTSAGTPLVAIEALSTTASSAASATAASAATNTTQSSVPADNLFVRSETSSSVIP